MLAPTSILLPICFFLGWHYQRVLLHPNEPFFSIGGDGLRSYYVAAYHVRYDDAYLWFGGMNYPYGEHLVFTDGQPLVLDSVKWISRHLVDLSQHTTAVLNLLMLLSVFATAWLLYLVLRRFRVDRWFAAPAAAAIALLSPQCVRMLGHHSLAYSFALPLTWYLALRFFDGGGTRDSLRLALAVFLLAWMHPYHLMIGVVFVSSMWAWHLLRSRERRAPASLAHVSMQIVLPAVLFRALLGLTDPVTDRPDPLGFQDYTASWRTVFLPYSIPFLAERLRLAPFSEAKWEGMAYVGALGVACFAAYWLRLNVRVWRRLRSSLQPMSDSGSRSRRAAALIRPSANPLLGISVLAGLTALPLAFGFPFAIVPERMTELFPPIKQFRSLGRFAWIFYYTWATYAFYLVYLSRRRLRGRGYARGAAALCAGALVLALAEAWLYHDWLGREVSGDRLPDLSRSETATELDRLLSGISPHRYSALWVFPYFHVGSESFVVQDPGAARTAYAASLRTGLPLLNVMMSRTSLDQTWSHLELMTEPYRERSLPAQISDHRPILQLGLEQMENRFDRTLFRRNADLPQTEQYALGEIRPEELRTAGIPQAMPLPAESVLYRYADGLFANRADPALLLRTFDDGAPGSAYLGKGGYRARLERNNVLFDGTIAARAGDTIVISLWARLREERLPRTGFGLEVRRPNGDVVFWDYSSLNDFLTVIDGEWALCERELVLQDPNDRVYVNVTRWKPTPPHLDVDELLIRRKGTHLYGVRDGMWFADGRVYPLPRAATAADLLEGRELRAWK